MTSPAPSTPIASAVAAFLPGPDTESDNAFARERVTLRHTTPSLTLGSGNAFPDGRLVRADGQDSSVASERAGKPLVVVFYRGAWCPFCNIALRAYQDHLVPELRRRGIGFMAISPQLPDGSLTMQEKQQLDFAVVSDPHSAIASALGILTRPTEDAIRAQLDGGLDLTRENADGTAILPMPTTVIVDAHGIIRWIDVHPDYTTRTEPAEVLRALDDLDITGPAEQSGPAEH